MDEIERIKEEKMRKYSEELIKKVIDVDENNFEKEVIEKSKKVPVVVDFWAAWCTPCLMLSPILDRLLEEYKGRFVLVKLNVDQNREISMKYRISGIPAVKMFRAGKVVDQFIGVLPEPVLRQWLDKNLSGN